MHDHAFDATEIALRPKTARAESRAGGVPGQGPLTPDGITALQRLAGNAAVSGLVEDEERSPVHDVISSGGRPLEPEVRTDMEGRLGHDFSDVRVHDDSAAHTSAQAVNAHAYTVGSNVVFQRDQYNPHSDDGRVTLAHELTHVIQQRNGPVDGTPAEGGISVSHPSDRFEREASANAQAVAGPGTATPSSVQRAEAEESEEQEQVQGLFVQRAEDEEEVGAEEDKGQ